MNAVDLLIADHKVVAELFKKVEASDESEHPAIFNKIKAELDVHAHIEETIFYPKMEADGDKPLVDIVLEGVEEHRQVKMFLKELDADCDLFNFIFSASISAPSFSRTEASNCFLTNGNISSSSSLT